MVCVVRSLAARTLCQYGSRDVQHLGRYCSMDRMMGENRKAGWQKARSSATCMERILEIGGQTAKKARKGRRLYLLLVQIKLQNNNKLVIYAGG